MSRPTHTFDFDLAIVQYVDGSISADDLAELNARLRDDDALRAAFVRRCRVIGELHERHVSGNQGRTTEDTPPIAAQPISWGLAQRIRGTRLPVIIPLAAALLLAAAAVAVYFATLTPDPRPLTPDSSAPVATILDTTPGSTLLVDDTIVNSGDDIRSGTLSLDAGSADFRLGNGVAVTLRGQTQLTVHDPMSATLTRGSASFDCPHTAKGYTVHLPSGARVVDVGTAFDLVVKDDHATHVRVTSGSVHVVDRRNQRVTLDTHRVAKLDAAGVLVDSPPAIGAVAATGPLEHYRLDTLTGENGDAMTAAPGATIQQSTPAPALAPPAFPGFESANAWANFDGTIASVIGDLVTGWGSDAGTICYWTRLDPGGNPLQPGLFAGSADNNASFTKTDNAIFTFHRTDGRLGVRIGSKTVVEAPVGTASLNAWHHVAFTWQRNSGSGDGAVTVYLDGNPVASTAAATVNSFTIHAARFGKPIYGNKPVYKGSMDELVVWTRALSAEDVLALYAAATIAQPNPPAAPVDPAASDSTKGNRHRETAASPR